MAERCNCDASCGENRYHDTGDPGCRFADDNEYTAYWDRERARFMPKEKKMATMIKVSDKLVKVNENFTVYMYDNGYMLEISGTDKKEEYKTSKLMVSSVDELVTVIKEITSMGRTE